MQNSHVIIRDYESLSYPPWALPPLFLRAGQRSYVELLRGRRESLGTRLVYLAFWRQFFNRILTSNRILQTNGDIQRKGQGGSKEFCQYDFLFASYGRWEPGDLGGGGTVAP